MTQHLDTGRVGSKTIVERRDRALDAVAQLHKDWDDGCTFVRPDLFERYLDGRIEFHLKFCARLATQTDPVNLFTVLDCPMSATVGEFNPEMGIGAVVLDDNPLVSLHQGMGDDEKQPMFVCDIQVMDDLKKRIVGVRCPVWLKGFDQGTMLSGDPPCYSLFNGISVFLRRHAHRKGDPGFVGDAVSLSQRPDHMVVTRSEMMDNLASQNGNARRRFGADNFKGVSLALRLKFLRDGVSFTIQEASNIGIEIVDLLFSPLNLRSAPV